MKVQGNSFLCEVPFTKTHCEKLWVFVVLLGEAIYSPSAFIAYRQCTITELFNESAVTLGCWGLMLHVYPYYEKDIRCSHFMLQYGNNNKLRPLGHYHLTQEKKNVLLEKKI